MDLRELTVAYQSGGDYTAATVLGVILLPEEVNTARGPHMQLLIWQMFFTVSKDYQKQLALSGKASDPPFALLPRRLILLQFGPMP